MKFLIVTEIRNYTATWKISPCAIAWSVFSYIWPYKSRKMVENSGIFARMAKNLVQGL